jgi:hypothetical protein
MNKSINDNELEAYLRAARAAGDAEGYARAKFEMALEKAKAALESGGTKDDLLKTDITPAKAEKLETLRDEAEKTEKTEPYKTRMTVSMTKAIAIDYLKNTAPRIVGPSEIIKNTKKNLGIFISFGTLNRAMEALVEAGEVELVEKSRWRFKDSAGIEPKFTSITTVPLKRRGV